MPALKDRFESLGTLIKTLIALVALLPGIAVLTGLVNIPPTLVQLVKFLSVFVSLAVMIAVFLMERRLAAMRLSMVAAVALVAVIVGCTSAVEYWAFANRHIVVLKEGSEVSRFVVPLRPSADIQRLMIPYDGDYAEALETSVHKERLAQLMEKESATSVAVMVLLLVLSQTLLLFGVVAGAWRLTMRDTGSTRSGGEGNRKDVPPPPSSGG